jgi:hypothetical protein
MRPASVDVPRCADEASSSNGPRRIGELMPGVLARYGIRHEHASKAGRATALVLVQPVSDVATGMSESLAMA